MVDNYAFGYPRECDRCAELGGAKLSLRVLPFYHPGGTPRLMLIGQDPTIRRHPERVKYVLMLDQPNGQLSRWLRELMGPENLESCTLYATNLVKCSFAQPPSDTRQGGLKFLGPYFDNCKGYLAEEIGAFQPTLVLTLGEPAHRLFISTLDKGDMIAQRMKDAFTGAFVRGRVGGVEFDYSPCLHIQGFRVAETYGSGVNRFKEGLSRYFGAVK